MLFTFFEGSERGDDTTDVLLNQRKPELVTEAELKDYFEGDNAGVLRKQFGSFDNYLNYMTEREALIQSGEYDPGSWGNVTSTTSVQNAPGIDPADITGLSRNEFIAKYGLDPSEVQTTQIDTNAARWKGWREWSESPAVKALNDKYGISSKITTDEGDEYHFNGTSLVKTKKMPTRDTKIVAGIAVGALLGYGFNLGAGQLLSGLGSTTASVAGGMASSAVSQVITTGKIDPTSLFTAGVTAGILDTADILSQANLAGTEFSSQNIDALIDVMGSETYSALDSGINSVAQALGTDYNTALKIVQGVSTGAINGGDLEGIVTGAATTLGANKIANYVEDNLGLVVPNLFDEGTTEINKGAVEEMSRQFLQDVAAGEVDEGTLLDMGLGYNREDGTFSFLDPGLNQYLPETDGFFDFLPDVELMGGEGFDIDVATDEERLSDAIDQRMEAGTDQQFGEELDPNANIILQYDQDTVDTVTDLLNQAKEAGREFDDAVLQPVKEVIEKAGYAIDDYLLQPVKDGAQALWDMLPDAPELPEGPSLSGPEGEGVDLPSFSANLPDVEFKGSKPFGQDLKQFAPLGAPQLAPQTQIFGKAQTPGFDPRRSGSGIVSSLFSEYIG